MFSAEERLWIALHCENDSPTKLKMKFCKVFNMPKKLAANLKGLYFTRYKESFVNNLERNGTRCSKQSIIRS